MLSVLRIGRGPLAMTSFLLYAALSKFGDISFNFFQYESSVEGMKTCGDWCADEDPDTACSIDTRIMKCQGDFFCSSTCGLWDISILSPATKPVTCPSFMYTQAYPKGGELCAEECLLAELKPNRYPAPTGLGFFCAPGTCDPAVQSRYKGTFKADKEELGILECPCNWFGTDCTDDWVEITEVLRKETLGDKITYVFKVSDEGWKKIVANAVPGSVVRVQAYSDSAWGRRPLEQPYALAIDAETGTMGEVEVLTGPPEEELESTVIEIAKRVRALPVGPINDGKGKLYVNPAVANFKSMPYYTDFLTALSTDKTIENVVFLSTGAGLSGVRTGISKVLRDGGKKVHLYYGLRDARNLPYREQITGWIKDDGVSFTLAISSKESAAREADEPEISDAIAASDSLLATSKAGGARGGAVPSEMIEKMPSNGKLYAQHALAVSLAAGPLKEAGATFANTIVVICARNDVLLEIEPLVTVLPGASEYLPMRLFMNI